MSEHIEGLNDKHLFESRSGIEALQWTPGISGPVERLEGHENNDHLGFIYETQDEQFATVVPYIQQGIERGERCMYIADENSRDDIITALRDGNVNVETALNTGQLSIHSVEETYLKGGEFDFDKAYALLKEAMDEAIANYEGFRVTAEETWLVGDETTQEAFMACEAHVNELLDGEEAMALCQYNRDKLPPEVIEHVIKTHPYLIYDDTISENFYYTPPKEYFSSESPARDNERKLEMLVDRTKARTTLQTREQYQHEIYTTMSHPNLSFDEKLDELFEIGCERFNFEHGGMARVDPDSNLFEVEAISGDHEHLVPGAKLDLSETYCRVVADDGPDTKNAVPTPVEITDPAQSGFEDEACIAEFGLHTYLGTCIPVKGNLNRTFFFVSSESREEPISDAERTFHRLMAQWIKYELDRRQREEFLRDLYETTANSKASFNEKLESLLEVGSERFGLEIGYFTRTKDNDTFEIVEAVGEHDLIEAGVTDTLCDTYCEKLLASPGLVCVTDAAEAGWTDDRAYERFGLDAYFATTIHVGGEEYGTLCFASEKARDEPYTDADRTFLDLMGQWVSYELEHSRREQYLRESYEITSDPDLSFDEKLEKLLELGREWFGLEMAGLNHLPSWDDKFRLEKGIGPGLDTGDELWTDPGDGCFCRQTISADAPVGIPDVRRTGWEDDQIHKEFGLTSYLGAKIMDGSTPYGTLWFGSTEPREYPFSDTEKTFIELMGQWISYELERNHREAELREKNDRLESFASMLAHELRNPVTIGQIYSQQLPDEAGAEAVEHVTDAFTRIEDMIDVMLVLTRGREAVGERTAVSLTAIAQDIWDELDTVNADLDVTLDKTIHADETYIRHLFQNLLENAVEHGGEDVSVTVGEHPTGFYVADDGPGIPPEKRNTVFEAGYTTTAEQGGTGVGLAFVQKLADVYNWECTVTESATGGARFEFTGIDDET